MSENTRYTTTDDLANIPHRTGATDTATFEDIISAWDEPLICQSIYDCPNTATWLVVHHCEPSTGTGKRVVCCDWHVKRWLRRARLIIATHGYMRCDCGGHFTMPESSAAFTPL